jgi:hypothetical protein
MNDGLKDLLSMMLSRRIIGGKHIPERLMIRANTRWHSKQDQREFEKEYQRALNKRLLIRLKKRTWGGSEWHISLNPREIEEIRELIR